MGAGPVSRACRATLNNKPTQPSIASKFDPETGRWGLYLGEKPVFEVDMASGELRVNGRAVVVSYKE